MDILHTSFLLLFPLGIIIYGFIQDSISALIIGTVLGILFFNLSMFIHGKRTNCFLTHMVLAITPVFLGLINSNVIKGLVITISIHTSLIVNILCKRIKVDNLENHPLSPLNVSANSNVVDISEPLPVYIPKLPDYSES